VAEGVSYPIERLKQQQALLAVSRGEFDRAMALWAGAPEPQPMSADPFVIHLKDCVWCDRGDPKAVRPARPELAQRLAALQAEARRDPAKAAENELLIGAALFNVSLYGTSRDFGDAGTGHGAARSQTQLLNTAEEHLKIAYARAGDPELKAKIAFTAAKCELGRHYEATGGPRWRYGQQDAFRAGVWFRKLRDELSNASYTREILRECGYYRTFVDTKR